MAQRETTAKRKSQRIPVRDRLIINLALFTGLRVQEIADLKCGDIMIKEDTAFIIVQCGKGDKSRLVHFNGELKTRLKAYLEWKVIQGEGIQPADPLLFSRYPSSLPGPREGQRDAVPNGRPEGARSEALRSAGHLSKRAVQRAFERMSKAAGINNHCFHHLRHTYASHLYKASGYNLRLVQKQLGHASIRTTQVYADVFDEDLKNALEKLYQ